jgi:hypothetical protein
VNSGTAYTVTVTSANKADIGELPALLREQDEVIFGNGQKRQNESRITMK